MSYRTFAPTYFQIATGGTVQPLVGSWIASGTATAGVNVQLTLANGATGTTNGNDAALIFNVGDFIGIGDPNGTSALLKVEPCQITAVGTTTITVASMANNHVAGAQGTGSWVWLSYAKGTALYVQPKDGNTGDFYIGGSPLVTSTGKFLVKKLLHVAAAAQPNEFASSVGGSTNPLNVGELWMLGATTADKYAVTITSL